jgi:PAT family beta-lactamase induction signal transducer AmpG
MIRVKPNPEIDRQQSASHLLRTTYLLFFATVYFAQGATSSYILFYHKPYLADAGVEADQIAALSGLMSMPFVIKICFGMLSDRFALFGLGHRVPYLLIGMLAAALALLMLRWSSPTSDFTRFAILLVLATTCIALADVAADAYAVEVAERGHADEFQAAMTAGRALGLITTSFFFGILVTHWGWTQIFPIISVIVLLPLAWLAVLPRLAVNRASEVRLRDYSAPFDWSLACFLVFAFTMSAVLTPVLGLGSYFLSAELGADPDTLRNFATLTSVGLMLGSFIALLLGRWLGPRPTGWVGLLGLAAMAGWFSVFDRIDQVLVLGLANGVVWGVLVTLSLSLAMQRTAPATAAAMFAFIMACFNLGGTFGETLFTSLIEDIGFSGAFRMLAVLAILVVPLFEIVVRHDSRAQAQRS